MARTYIRAGVPECAGGVTAGVVDSKGPFGYLSEGSRQNRCLYSQDFSNAAWVSGGGGIAVSANSEVAPDGTTTADTLTASGANGTLIQDLGVVASAAKSGGLWLKRKTGTGNIDLTLDGGSTWTTKTLTTTWTRFSITQTLADEDFGIRIVTSGDAVYAWQGQVETASFLSSDIPVPAGSAITRAADSLTYTAAGNISGTVGTVCLETYLPTVSTAQIVVDIGNNRPIYVDTAARYAAYDGTNYAYSNSITVAGSLHKVALTYGGSAMQLGADGAQGTAGTFDGDMDVAGIYVGMRNNGSSQLFGTIRLVRIFNRVLAASQIAAVQA